MNIENNIKIIEATEHGLHVYKVVYKTSILNTEVSIQMARTKALAYKRLLCVDPVVASDILDFIVSK